MTSRGSDGNQSQRWTKGVPLLSTLGIGALALGLGLAIRPWLTENRAEAGARPGLDAQAAPGSYGTPQPEAISAGESLATPDAFVQTSGGIQVSAANFRREDGRLKADVCFDLPDNSDWTIWAATLRYQGGLITEFGGTPIEVREPENSGKQRVIYFDEWRHTVAWEPAPPGARGRRCDTLYFELPTRADFSTFTITIQWIAAAPREGEVCTPAYLERIQQALERRIAGVHIECKQQTLDSGVVEGLRVVSAPSPSARQEAEALLSSTSFFLEVHGIEGPWRFTGSLSK